MKRRQAEAVAEALGGAIHQELDRNGSLGDFFSVHVYSTNTGNAIRIDEYGINEYESTIEEEERTEDTIADGDLVTTIEL